jgi:hypothetical protein
VSRTVLAGCGCAALAIGAVLVGGGIWDKVAGLDLYGISLPKYEAAARAARELRLPLWNPYEFCGMPLLGNAQGALLYPPVILLFGALPARAALQALYGFHFLVLACGMIAYLARHGVRPLAGALGALVATAGVLELRSPGIDHPSFIGAACWLPAMLLCAENAAERGVRPWVGLLALAAAAQWLAGYPDFALDAPVLMALVMVISGYGSRGLARLGLGVALGAALAALQLMPLAEAIGESTRVEGQGAYAVWRSGVAVHSLSFFARSTLERYGPAALVLVAVACWRPTRVQLGWLAALLWATFALNFPLKLLYHLPPYAEVRFPLGWRFLAPVFVGLLAALAVGSLVAAAARWRRAAGVVLGIAAAFWATRSLVRAPHSLSFDAPSRALVEERVPLLRARLAPTDRLVSPLELATGAPLRHELRSPTGYEPSLPPRRIVSLLDVLGIHRNDWTAYPLHAAPLTQRGDVAALLGVGLVTVPEAAVERLTAAGFAVTGVVPPGDVVLFREPLPRARVVHRVVVAADDRDSLARTLATVGDAGAVVVEAQGAALALAPPAAGAVEEAVIVVDEPERVEIDARVASPGLLVLADTFFPGWHVTVDGAPADILRVAHAFRGVAVAPGRHRIVFRYAPRSVWLGGAVSLAAALVIAALVLPRR